MDLAQISKLNCLELQMLVAARHFSVELDKQGYKSLTIDDGDTIRLYKVHPEYYSKLEQADDIDIIFEEIQRIVGAVYLVG